MDDPAKILIVEDDKVIRTVLEMSLHGAGFRHFESVGRGDDALRLAAATKPDLVLLDLMLPGLDGLSVARRIRENGQLADTRIIMVTARTEEEDIVRGLDAGADDYIPKPFSREVLLARVRAVLRRSGGERQVAAAGLRLDDSSRSATIDGERVRLSPTEFIILELLVRNRGRVLTRSRMLGAIAGDEKSITERNIDVQLVGLRRKLGSWGAKIETIRGVGYRIAP